MMGTIKTATLCCRRGGFTVVEVLIVSGLMSLLVVMISAAWFGLGRSSRDVVLRCRIAQEANLAAETLTRDFGGHLPDEPMSDPQCHRFWDSRVHNGQLQIYFAAGPVADDEDLNDDPPWDSPSSGDTVITYQLQENEPQGGKVQTYNLVRLKARDGTETEFTVATNLLGMDVEPTILADGVDAILLFPYPDARDRGEANDYIEYTIQAKDPS